jgi:hypothetical protein
VQRPTRFFNYDCEDQDDGVHNHYDDDYNDNNVEDDDDNDGHDHHHDNDLMTKGSKYSYNDSGDVKHELLVSSDVVCIAGLIQVHGQGQTKGRLVDL